MGNLQKPEASDWSFKNALKIALGERKEKPFIKILSDPIQRLVLRCFLRQLSKYFSRYFLPLSHIKCLWQKKSK